MADHTPVNLPDEYEALLRRAMAVEPEPQFAARVRQHIELEPRRSSWGLWFVTAGAVAAAALAVIVLLPLRVSGPPLPPIPPLAPATVVASPPLVHPALSKPLGVAAPQVRGTRQPREAAHPSESFSFPEVIVDRRQRAALDALARFGAQGTMPEEVLAKLIDAPASIPPVITVAPLVVSPIGIGGVLQYESERR
jgi:hypothetical protein